MRVPAPLIPLVDEGVIQEVLRPLMAGKEAQVFLVRAAGELRIAKVYKEASARSFKHRAEYTEGRRVKNSRRARAMNKRSKYGRAQVEAAWRSAEVEVIYRLVAAGVRVPRPFDFIEGVLVMELICDEWGEPAPRLVDLSFHRDEADEIFHHLIREVTRMLCAGVVHADLSDFNVLIGHDGPVIIDFPQAVDASQNRGARRMLLRDVNNLVQFLGRFAPHLKGTRFGEEMWGLYERGELEPDTRLTGRWRRQSQRANTDAILEEIAAAAREEARRREALGLPPPRPARKPVALKGPPPKPVDEGGGGGRRRGRRARPRREARRDPRGQGAVVEGFAFCSGDLLKCCCLVRKTELLTRLWCPAVGKKGVCESRNIPVLLGCEPPHPGGDGRDQKPVPRVADGRLEQFLER